MATVIFLRGSSPAKDCLEIRKFISHMKNHAAQWEEIGVFEKGCEWQKLTPTWNIPEPASVSPPPGKDEAHGPMG